MAQKQYKLHENSLELRCHRPRGANGTHVSLYYPGFDEFLVGCTSQAINETDATFISNLTCEMSGKFDLEAHRVRDFLQLLNDYLKLGVPVIDIDDTDGAILFYNPMFVSVTFLQQCTVPVKSFRSPHFNTKVPWSTFMKW